MSLWRSEDFLELEGTGGCDLPRECWELNLDFGQGQ